MLSDYTNLITSEHADKPNFMAMIAVQCQPLVDVMAMLQKLPGQFDIDDAVASQLDDVGLWVGESRQIATPLTGVYFAFDTAGVGFDQGTWFGPYDDINGLTSLPDDAYRLLLYAKIANNQWDGSVPSAYTLLSQALPDQDIIIQDNGDMTMLLGVYGGGITDAVQLALLEHGYLDVKPAGVRISYYISPSVTGPLFGFDVEDSPISGFDVGGWATLTPGR